MCPDRSGSGKTGVDGEAGEIDQHGDDHPRADEGFFVQTAFEKKGAPEGALVAGEAAEKTAQKTAGWEIFFFNRQSLEGGPQFQGGKSGHEHGNDQFHRLDRESAAGENILVKGRKVRQPQQQTGA